MLDDFIEKLRIERGGTLLLTENSLTLLMTIKKIDEALSSDILTLYFTVRNASLKRVLS